MQPDTRSSTNTDGFLKLLRQRLREEGFSLRSVSRSLGWHEDYLSQLCRGTPRLRIDQLFEILDAIGLAPSDFFAEVVRSFERLEDAAPAGRPSAAVSDALTPRELEEVLALVDSRIEVALGGGGRRAAGTSRRSS